jgi:hypothetical protein
MRPVRPHGDLLLYLLNEHDWEKRQRAASAPKTEQAKLLFGHIINSSGSIGVAGSNMVSLMADI